jgi:uncharacterized membrane protein (UPF0127 family)
MVLGVNFWSVKIPIPLYIILSSKLIYSMKFYNLKFLSIILLFASLIIGCGSEKKESKTEPSQGRELDLVEEVTFLTADGNEVSTIRVALADDADERNQGLMDVNQMASDAGMLFIFPNEEQRSFYMANTPLPLDIMFVSSDSTIVRIHHNTAPFNSSQLPSGKPAKFVVETNAGYSVANDIQEGMRIRF